MPVAGCMCSGACVATPGLLQPALSNPQFTFSQVWDLVIVGAGVAGATSAYAHGQVCLLLFPTCVSNLSTPSLYLALVVHAGRRQTQQNWQRFVACSASPLFHSHSCSALVYPADASCMRACISGHVETQFLHGNFIGAVAALSQQGIASGMCISAGEFDVHICWAFHTAALRLQMDG